jgi:pimeloyl-ACP methyl ester carboxylesterase
LPIGFRSPVFALHVWATARGRAESPPAGRDSWPSCYRPVGAATYARTVDVHPFTIRVDEATLTDLRHRIRATRWPERETVGDWSQGVPLGVMRDLAAYWAGEYDWRRFESRMAPIPQFTTRIDGVEVHFLHVRSSRSQALPLLITHGWPGSFVEFLDVITPLAEPPAGEQPFHLVIPSLPGYGFSTRPPGTGWGIERIAGAWSELMARLGYERYGATGGDWGTSVTTMLALRNPEHLVGLHLTPPLVAPDPATFDDLTDAEREGLQILDHAAEGSAYSAVHRSRPQTLGYSLMDSPVGLAAWIFEKLAAWCDGEVFDVLTRDQVLDNITLYWLTGTGASSTRLYWESIETVER